MERFYEYMDEKMMQCMDKQNMLLLLQTAGTPTDAKHETEKMVEILKKLNPTELKSTKWPFAKKPL